jgi:hypothetical protein
MATAKAIRRGARNKIDGTKPSKPLESTSGFARVAQGWFFMRCGSQLIVQSAVATGDVFPRRGPFLWTRPAHDELKGEFVEATTSRGPARSAAGTGARDQMDCLTEQTQFLLKTKDLSRNKPKQSQNINQELPLNSLIPWTILAFWQAFQSNIQKPNVLNARAARTPRFLRINLS